MKTTVQGIWHAGDERDKYGLGMGGRQRSGGPTVTGITDGGVAAREACGMAIAKHWIDASGLADAPDELRGWALATPSLSGAWASCPRGDYLLWLAARLAGTDEARRAVVLAACDCARTTLPFVPPDDPKPRRAIEDAERWARGETVDIAEMNAALRAASDEADAEHAEAGTARAHDATAYAAVAAATAVALAQTWAAAGALASAVGSAAAAYAAASGHAAAMAARIAHPEEGIAVADGGLAAIVRKRVPAPG